MEKKHKLKKVQLRFVTERNFLSEKPIKTPKDAVDILAQELKNLPVEHVMAVFLATDGHPISCTTVSIGSVNLAMFPIAEIMKGCLLSNAPCVLMMHSHPSGNVEPSSADLSVTRKLSQACAIMDIQLVDHIIVGGNSLYSFRDKGLIEQNTRFLDVAES